MARKKKKSHGGLKFIAFLVVVTALIMSFSMLGKSEMGQRLSGKREDRRIERTQLTHRFGFASARLRETIGSIYNSEGAVIDLTTTSNMSIDRESSTVTSDIVIERTATQVAPGVNAIPFDALNAKFTEILTKGYRYESPEEPGEPWLRQTLQPYYYGSPLDDHYIPMIDDIMGFELRELPFKSVASAAPSGFKRPSVDNPTASDGETESYEYELDMDTFTRVIPILAGRTGIDAPPTTAVTLTLAFDDVGLLRFLDVAIPSDVATTLAQRRGTGRSGVYHYTLEVTEISGEAIPIELPTDVVDDDSATLPVTVI